MRLVILLLLCAIPARATLVLPEAVQRQRLGAPLEAEIEVERLESIPDENFDVRSLATARVTKILRITDDGGWFPREGQTLTIETLGGEMNGTGVLFSGYPRPYAGQSYRATLRRTESGHFQVAGFGTGLVSLRPSRGYSRNRTDGSNGAGTGPFLYWDAQYFPVPYYMSLPTLAGHENIVRAIDASFKTWRNPQDVTLEFLPMGCTSNVLNRNDSVNSIVLIKSGWQFDPDAIAITRNFYVSGSGAHAGMILDTDILLNGVNHGFTTTGEAGKHDVQNILTHEVGHFIGMGHETDPKDSDATMFENAQLNGETKKRDLASSDTAGLRAGYSGVGKKLDLFPTTAACSIERQTLSCLSVHQGRPVPPEMPWVATALFGALIWIGRRLARCAV